MAGTIRQGCLEIPHQNLPRRERLSELIIRRVRASKILVTQEPRPAIELARQSLRRLRRPGLVHGAAPLPEDDHDLRGSQSDKLDGRISAADEPEQFSPIYDCHSEPFDRIEKTRILVERKSARSALPP